MIIMYLIKYRCSSKDQYRHRGWCSTSPDFARGRRRVSNYWIIN